MIRIPKPLKILSTLPIILFGIRFIIKVFLATLVPAFPNAKKNVKIRNIGSIFIHTINEIKNV